MRKSYVNKAGNTVYWIGDHKVVYHPATGKYHCLFLRFNTVEEVKELLASWFPK